MGSKLFLISKPDISVLMRNFGWMKSNAMDLKNIYKIVLMLLGGFIIVILKVNVFNCFVKEEVLNHLNLQHYRIVVQAFYQ